MNRRRELKTETTNYMAPVYELDLTLSPVEGIHVRTRTSNPLRETLAYYPLVSHI
jgi:hypothetical protein